MAGLNPPFTIGWWNNFAAAACGVSGGGEPPIIAASANDTLTVETVADLLVVIHVWREQLSVPCRLVRPLLGGLLHLDSVGLPLDDTGYHHKVNAELTLELQQDASVVIAIGADDDPADAIEVPGVQVERLKQTLRGILR